MIEYLKRTPEPDLMDELIQARAYANADFAVPHQQCADLCARLHGTLTGAVLDLGCGPGDVLVRHARLHPAARFLGVDGAPVMLTLAREYIAAQGMGASVEVAQHYLPSESLPSQSFDAVLSNSLLHHLEDPSALWETIRKTGKPGARIFVMDLMRPDTEAQLEQLVERHATGAEPILLRDFRASLHAAYRCGEVEAQLVKAGLDLTVEAVSDRHLICWGTLHSGH